MAPPPPSADFDEGIFLVHLNKGQELLGKGSLEEARQELEKARSLRPDHDKALNLLGMLYFKMERHTEAREVYERLIQIHPEESVLHSNLGIIEFKEGKLEAAEPLLKRALELDPSNSKPHSYLGLLYNRLEDLDRAAEHFRRAGMTKMLEKVEQKRRERRSVENSGRGMARAGADFRIQSPEATRSVPVVPPAGAPPVPSVEGQGPLSGPLDIDSVLAGLSALGENVISQPPLQPPAAAGAPPEAAGEELDILGGLLSSAGGLEPLATEVRPPARPAHPEPPRAPARPPAAVPAAPFPPTAGPHAAPLDLGAAPVPAARLGTHTFGPFRRPGHGLIEMQVRERVFIRRGSVTHYAGRLDFQRDRASGLILVQGQGSLFLGEDDTQTLLVELAGHALSVSATHLLSFGEGVHLEGAPLRLGPGESGLRGLRLAGHGCVALSIMGETICMDVEADRPTAVDPRRVVGWSGDLRAEVNASEILREVMAASAQGMLAVRFEGRGTVLVEQPGPAQSPSRP